jgi:hypothetical protein
LDGFSIKYVVKIQIFFIFIKEIMNDKDEAFVNAQTHHQPEIDHPIEKEITQSYIDYSMSVIISRALPDTRD